MNNRIDAIYARQSVDKKDSISIESQIEFLPLKHPVNLAYEAATADLNDVNMIDPFHK